MNGKWNGRALQAAQCCLDAHWCVILKGRGRLSPLWHSTLTLHSCLGPREVGFDSWQRSETAAHGNRAWRIPPMLSDSRWTALLHSRCRLKFHPPDAKWLHTRLFAVSHQLLVEEVLWVTSDFQPLLLFLTFANGFHAVKKRKASFLIYIDAGCCVIS